MRKVKQLVKVTKMGSERHRLATIILQTTIVQSKGAHCTLGDIGEEKLVFRGRDWGRGEKLTSNTIR